MKHKHEYRTASQKNNAPHSGGRYVIERCHCGAWRTGYILKADGVDAFSQAPPDGKALKK